MQDKKLDDMTQKYKEEMMRLYSKNLNSQAPAVQPRAHEEVPAKDLSHPPMPEIPKTETVQAVEPKADTKFPPAEELLRGAASSAEAPDRGNYSAAAEDRAGGDIIPINENYPDEKTDFSAVDEGDSFPADNPADMSGKGYLQIEVTTASGAVPVKDATVIVTENTNGMNALVSMLITDESGATPVIPLSAPSQTFSESPDPSERPYSEYSVAVYKKGFYSVPALTVPVFDTIKSIQPVSVIPLAEFEQGGAEVPNENR